MLMHHRAASLAPPLDATWSSWKGRRHVAGTPRNPTRRNGNGQDKVPPQGVALASVRSAAKGTAWRLLVGGAS
jgi:hypothetical protein